MFHDVRSPVCCSSLLAVEQEGRLEADAARSFAGFRGQSGSGRTSASCEAV